MNLEIDLAKYNLGLIGMTEFPEIALNILISGKESESLIILAGMN